MKKIIKSSSNISMLQYFEQMWKYRYMVYSLSKGELKNKYAKTFTGLFLSVIQTIIGLLVYWLIFGVIIKVDTGGTIYPVFALPGIITWQAFSNIVGNSCGALTSHEQLINKLYFPRINLVFSKILPSAIDFLIGFALFVVMFFLSKHMVNILWLHIPIIFIILIITALTFGLWISILSLYIRDLGQIILYLTNFLIFITPVFYPGTIVPSQFKFILYLNPVAGIIEYFRSILFYKQLPENEYFIGIFVVVILFISAFFVYKKIDKQITDLL